MKTKHRGITYNEKNGTYTAKYNYKEFDALKGENVYKSKYAYNCRTLTEAKEELRRLANEEKPESKEITLDGIFDAYKKQAEARKLATTTIDTTATSLKTIYRYIPASTKMKMITQDTLNQMIISMRNDGLKESTIKNHTNTLKKLFRLAYQRE